MNLNSFYHHPIFERLFKTTVYLLKKELKDCESVLDLGCGPDSPLKYCENVNYSVGVEAFKPYYERAKEKDIHSEYFLGNIEDLQMEENSFDAVILVEVVEHMPKEVGLEIIKKAKKWAKKKVIVTTPNGFLSQPAVDNNPLQKHLSGWSPDELRDLGFKLYGLSGLKFLREPKEEADSMAEDITISMKYKPKIFWFIIAALSQIITYYFPRQAFELFCVNDLDYE